MIIANRTLVIIDGAFTIIDRIERVDYIKLGEQIIDKAIIAAAIISAVTSYVITALQLFWLQHGERIMSAAVMFTVNTVDYMHEVYLFGKETRRFIVKLTNYFADRAFYTITALN